MLSIGAVVIGEGKNHEGAHLRCLVGKTEVPGLPHRGHFLYLGLLDVGVLSL